MRQIADLESYLLKEERYVEELHSKGYILEHKKTGARIFLLSNDDENKVFCIGFRTPPSDSTGVAHILEHSVLCGSEKFPVKDPFVELVKGSLNTFLNAMTYPDKTVYPVASCNEKDFQNLMDVYMDAVLHPNIYKEEKIFRQEGWHYEMESEDSPVTLNGVVYNEMKGAFSSPESVLDRYTRNVLYPDTCYGCESGGDPAVIPELSYEDFLNFHKTYYHPSNSYIYLYGDMDMAEKLDWLDREYLSRYDRLEADSRIRSQKAFDAPREREIFYPITESESEENSTYLSVSSVVGEPLNPIHYLAFQVLEYVLIDAPGAPLKTELLNAGIGQDILGGYENGILQPYFSVIAKDANREQKGEFLAVVQGTLRRLADQGLNKKSLLAAINYYEFRSREADFGSFPKGLMYGLQCLDSWLYEGDPLLYLEYEEAFAFLKKSIEEGYFEDLIRTWLLDNPSTAVILVSPKKNMTAEEDKKLEEKLAAYRETLTQEQRTALAQATKELKEYQDAPSPKEDLEKIPLLRREDINPEPEKLILGCRNFDQDNVPAKSEWGNKITRQVLKYLCGVAVSDTQTGLRGIPAAFMRHLMNVKGERFEFETYMLLEAGEQKVGIREVPIETVYLNDNKGSHFNPLLDSARIYLVFAKFLFSSLSSCIIDLVLFALFCSLTKERMPEAVSYIVVSTVLARVVSAGYNFFLNYRVVFKSSGAVWKSAVRYFVLAVVQMLASAGLVSLLYGVLGGSEVAVKILVDVFLFFISFLIQREIVYR